MQRRGVYLGKTIRKTTLGGLLVVLGLAASAQSAYFQQEVNYKMDVRLNDVTHALSAVQQIEYINNAPVALEVIWLHLWPNAYKSNQTALARQLTHQNRLDLLYAQPEERGYIDSLDFRVNGERVKWEFDAQHPDICKLMLKQPLRALDTLYITTPFYVKIPDAKFSRLGHTGQSYFITQWYPKPAVYDQDGWHPLPYLDQGEFYSEFGSFDVKITLPDNYLLAATGDRIDAAEEETFLNNKVIETLERLDRNDFRAGDMDFPESSPHQKTVRFRQYRVHDFAWFADKRFNVIHDQVELPTSRRTVDTWVFFTNKNFALWKQAITYVNESTLFYSYLVGDYPYNQVTAVDGTIMAGGGMEYPTITVIGDMSRPEDLDVTIAHEVGHNWFYGVLANNERDEPFLDEGINSFYELRYLRAKYPLKKFTDYIGQDSTFRFLGLNRVPYWKEKEILFTLAQRARIDQPIRLRADKFTMFNYGTIIYGKAPVVFDYLLDYMGEDNFDKAMRFYYEQFRFKHPQPNDLFKTLSFYSGKDLSWLTNDLMTTTRPLDYAIRRVRQNKDGSFTLTVKNKTGLAGPLNIYGYKNGTAVGRVDFDGFEKKRRLDFPPADVDLFKIDGEDRMPDLHRRNNFIRAHGWLKKARRPQLGFLLRFEDPQRAQVHYLPLLGSNAYNRFMLGAAVYNYGVYDKTFDYLLAPLFAFGTRTPVGFAEFNYRLYPRWGVKAITLGLKAKTFAYDRFETRLLNEANGTAFSNLDLNFYKLAPSLSFEFAKRKADSHLRQQLTYTSHQLLTDSLDARLVSNIAVQGPQRRQVHSWVNVASYELQNKRPLDPFALQVEVQHNAAMAKASASFLYRLQTGRHYFMEFRLFAGLFLAGTADARAYYAFRPDGYNGTDDYLFNYNYVGRNQSGWPGYNQFTDVDGAMKVPVLFGNGRYQMLALNLRSPKLFLLPVKLFADLVLTDRRDRLQDPLLWDAGLNVTLVKDIVDVYLPLFYSNDISRTLQLNGMGFGQRIRFTVNIHKLDPKAFIKNNVVK